METIDAALRANLNLSILGFLFADNPLTKHRPTRPLCSRETGGQFYFDDWTGFSGRFADDENAPVPDGPLVIGRERVWHRGSAIVDSDGTILQSMDDKEGIGIANITIDPDRKTRADRVCTGVGIAELAVGGSAGAAAVADEYARAQKSYDSNPTRQARRFRSQGSPEILSLCGPRRMQAFEVISPESRAIGNHAEERL